MVQRTRSTDAKGTSHRVIGLLAALAKGPAKLSVAPNSEHSMNLLVTPVTSAIKNDAFIFENL